MNINEIREYLTEISPQWMANYKTHEWSVERELSDEHPRCIDFCQPPWAVGAGIYADIYPVVDGETVSYIPLHLLPVVTREMLDEAVHWEETGEVPEWFPEELSK